MRYRGTPVSGGVAMGRVFLYRPFTPAVDDRVLSPGGEEEEYERYRDARNRAQTELETLRERFYMEEDGEKAEIFAAHLEILVDETMEEEIDSCILTQRMNAPTAVRTVYGRYAAIFEALDDPLLRERCADLRDVERRLLRCWEGLAEQNLSQLPGPVVVAAHDLAPSDTATLDRANVLAFVTEVGGSTSHTAIIARSYELPALLGVSGIMEQLGDGERVALDAEDGVLTTSLTKAEEEAYAKKRESVLRRQAQTRRYLSREPVTPDGVRVEVELNLADPGPAALECSHHTDGVGLFRSEFLYLGRQELPGEEEQFQAYRKVLLTYGERPVVLRTLDIGGDKPLGCLALPHEDNPFLGNRALRLCFQRPDLFRTQLRAALRASVFGNLWLMFPMVGSLDDIRRAKAAVAQAQRELDGEGLGYAPNIKLGIMIEIPSIALLADQAAQEVDFASIGTNDLTQYTCAADRGNPAASAYYQTYHPALFRLIGYVVREFARRQKCVGVCGELGGDPLAAAVLLGLGMRRLSMGAASIAPIKRLICSLPMARAEQLAEAVQALPTAEAVREYLMSELHDAVN